MLKVLAGIIFLLVGSHLEAQGVTPPNENGINSTDPSCILALQ